MENAMKEQAPKLGMGMSLIYCGGQLGGNIINMVLANMILYFYTNDIGREKPYLSMFVMGAIMVLGRIVDAGVDPLIGFWSDNTRTRLGRRRPFIIVGAPLLGVAFVLLFAPLFPAGSVALIISTIILMGLFWFFFSIIMNPYLALIPEIAGTSQQRVGLTTMMAIAMLLANGYQMMAASNMIDVTKWNMGYLNMALISAGIATVLTLITGIWIKEKPPETIPVAAGESEEKYSFFDAFRWTFKNKAFVVYIAAQFLFKLGFASLMSSMFFIVTRLMGKTEGFVGKVALFIVPGFIVSFFIINMLAKKFGKVNLYKVCLLLFGLIIPLLFFIGRVNLPLSPAVAGIIIIGLLSFPIAGDMVLPMAILGDITDYDQKLTGHHREAMYFGMQGLLQKTATAMSLGMQALLFGCFGYSMENHLGINLLGPVAGFCCLIGFVIFLRFPLSDKPQRVGK